MRKPMPKGRKEPNPKGDGMRMATKEKPGTEKGRATKGKDPEKLKSDGMKIAAKGESMKRSKLSGVGGARQAVR